MSELEAIKARAAAPAIIYETYRPAHHYVTALEESQADVPKLVALIEKIRDDGAQRANEWEATADRLWKQVRDRDPDRSVEDAQRYTAYAISCRGNAHIIDKTIKEGLTP